MVKEILKDQIGIHMAFKGSSGSFSQEKKNTTKSIRRKKSLRVKRRRVRVRESVSFVVRKTNGRNNALSS